MTDKELILNFVSQYDRPFNAQVMAQMTSVSIDAIKSLLPELLQNQAIKQIEDRPPIYVRANRYQARIGYQHYKGWTFSIADAHQLLDTLENGRYKSIRDIAQAVGKSRHGSISTWKHWHQSKSSISEASDTWLFPAKTCPKSAEESRKVYWVN